MKELRSNYIPELKHVTFKKHAIGALEAYWDSKMPFFGINMESTMTIQPDDTIKVIVIKRDKNGKVREREILNSKKAGIYDLFDDLLLKLNQRDSHGNLGGILEQKSSYQLSEAIKKITWRLRDETPGGWSTTQLG